MPLEQPEQVYLVGNTHLNFNTNRGDIKLAEVKLMTDAIAQLKNGTTGRMIIDFNKS